MDLSNYSDRYNINNWSGNFSSVTVLWNFPAYVVHHCLICHYVGHSVIHIFVIVINDTIMMIYGKIICTLNRNIIYHFLRDR